jgi:hypothetical protein
LTHEQKPLVDSNGQPLSKGKDSVLAEFVRNKSKPSTAAGATPSASGQALKAKVDSSDISKPESSEGYPLPQLVGLKQEVLQPPVIIDGDNADSGKSLPIISAPTLQQHLLSPVVVKNQKSVN